MSASAATCRAGARRRRTIARETCARRADGRRPVPPDSPAFSLIEVVAAVGIFAIGMLAVLALFAPVTKSVANVSDAEAAAKVADAVRARLQAMPFASALALIQSPADVRKKDSEGNYNPNDGAKNPAVLFGKLSGEVGVYDPLATPKGWYDSGAGAARLAPIPDAEKFFEIDLIRNEAISPPDKDLTAAVVAFHIRVRWPAFVAAPGGAAVQIGANPAGGGSVPYDHGKKQVMLFSGSILR